MTKIIKNKDFARCVANKRQFISKEHALEFAEHNYPVFTWRAYLCPFCNKYHLTKKKRKEPVVVNIVEEKAVEIKRFAQSKKKAARILIQCDKHCYMVKEMEDYILATKFLGDEKHNRLCKSKKYTKEMNLSNALIDFLKENYTENNLEFVLNMLNCS